MRCRILISRVRSASGRCHCRGLHRPLPLSRVPPAAASGDWLLGTGRPKGSAAQSASVRAAATRHGSPVADPLASREPIGDRRCPVRISTNGNPPGVLTDIDIQHRCQRRSSHPTPHIGDTRRQRRTPSKRDSRYPIGSIVRR
jgi:hypothetical protein